MSTSAETSIYDIPVVLKPAVERKKLREDLKEAHAALAEWEEEIRRIDKRLLELKGKR